VDKLFQHI